MTEKYKQGQNEYKPINPINLTDSEGFEWNRRYNKLSRSNGAVTRYKGIEKFMEFIEDGSLGVGSIVRVTNYGRIIDPHFIVTSKGLIDMLSKDEDAKPLSPQDVFKNDESSKPPVWEIVGFTAVFENNL